MKIFQCWWLIVIMVQGCSDGNEFETTNPITDDPPVTISENPPGDGSEVLDEPVPPPGYLSEIESLIDQVVVIPEFRWSLVAYNVGGGEVAVEAVEPDPNWISNIFTLETLLSPDQVLSANLDCINYSFEITVTSPSTFTLGLGEPVASDPLCVTNVPLPMSTSAVSPSEGIIETTSYVSSVFSDFENIVAEADGMGRLHVTNGNGIILIYAAAGL